MLAASLNAFFCASPIYGSAEDFRLSQNFTVSREVTPAAKQQIGETRKKRLAKRLAFFRFDILFGIIKGEQPLIRGSSASKSLVVFWFSFDIKREQLALMKKRSAPRTGARTISGSLLARKRELSPAQQRSYLFATAISARFSSRIRSSTVFTAVSTSAFGMRAMSTAHA